MKTVDVITLGRDAHGDYLNDIRRYLVKREVTLERARAVGVVGEDGRIISPVDN